MTSIYDIYCVNWHTSRPPTVQPRRSSLRRKGRERDFLIGIVQVLFERPLADEQLLGDFGVRESLVHQTHDLMLPLGQFIRRKVLHVGTVPVPERIEQSRQALAVVDEQNVVLLALDLLIRIALSSLVPSGGVSIEPIAQHATLLAPGGSHITA